MTFLSGSSKTIFREGCRGCLRAGGKPKGRAYLGNTPGMRGPNSSLFLGAFLASRVDTFELVSGTKTEPLATSRVENRFKNASHRPNAA